MTIDDTLKEIRQLHYPHTVDVREAVMQRVGALPSVGTVRPLWRRLTPVAAATVAMLLVVGLALPYLRSYDEESLSGTIVQLSDYGSWNTIESSAANPYEIIYE